MMSEERRTERVRVLGIQVNPIRVDKAVHQTSRLLEKHKFEYIVFANTHTALAELAEGYIQEAALVLPGDSNIEDAVEVRRFMEAEKSYQAEYFRRVCARLNKHGSTLYLAVQKEDELAKLQEIIRHTYSRLELHAVLWEGETSIDSKLNDINSVAPDVLLLCGNQEKMSEFIVEHGCKIHAGICFCMEEVVVDKEIHLPDWLGGSKFQQTYKNLKDSISRFSHNLLFKKKMKEIQAEETTEKDVVADLENEE